MRKTALITGASSGIGKELAKIHAEKGVDLIIVARRRDKLEALKKTLEDKYIVNIHIIEKDLTTTNAALEIYQEVKRLNLAVEILINNAGFGGLGRFDERDIATDVSMIQLNVTALTELTYYFLQDFKALNNGKILNVSSTASIMPGPFQAVYYASKAFVASFSNALSEELKHTNITVTNLMPGATASEFGKTSGMNKTDMFKSPASAENVAQDGYDGMMKGQLDVITGLTFSQKLMIKMIPFLPKKMVLKTVRKMQDV
ncbi:SDR family NAD(P)-dependent oxidoreductase [Brumimicrobium aurantiacum]|uniref:SDR family oxidoreductase n=1 Tax=Brumimicrobium aurantiacum TaxID=1737063 RepID=A0A3E1F1K3_9FLAO|nr:SDR family oxidoreductase [Brumimicrobium aurantiacum]RFC55623.1 SDR family oxidoreductase [Brumimicrobium aurantiacum]